MTAAPQTLSNTADVRTGVATNHHLVGENGNGNVYVPGVNSKGVAPDAKPDMAPGAKAQARLNNTLQTVAGSPVDPTASARAAMKRAGLSGTAEGQLKRYAALRQPVPKSAAQSSVAAAKSSGPQQTLVVPKNPDAEQAEILRNGPTNRIAAVLNFVLRSTIDPVGAVVGAGLNAVSSAATPVAPTIANGATNQPRPGISQYRGSLMPSLAQEPPKPTTNLLTTLANSPVSAALPASPPALSALRKPEQNLAHRKPPSVKFPVPNGFAFSA